MTDRPILRFVHDAPATGFLAAALPLVEDVCGVRLTTEGDWPELYWGNDPARRCLLRLPREAGYTETTVPGLDHAARPPEPGAAFPFDPITALRFWLTDEGNADAGAEAWDEHDRLRPEHSAQERLGVRTVPIVNAYLLGLRRWLAARLGMDLRNRLLPVGKRAAVVLSHDVDNPFNPGDVGHFLGLAARGLINRRPMAALRQAFYAARALRSRLSAPDDRHWVFDDVAAAEARHGFASTFYFSAVAPVSPTGHTLDVLYDIRQRALAPVFRRLTEAGAEIGLHASYTARGQAGRLAAERQAVEAACGITLSGNRHHYWHLRRPFWPCLAELAAAGLRYDSSIAFNDLPGYRLGVALPFRPFDPGSGTVIPLVEIPVMTMDMALCDLPGATLESALSTFRTLLDGLKQYEGIAAIDWHVRTSFPGSRQYQRWGETYLGMLDILAADGEVAVGRVGDFAP